MELLLLAATYVLDVVRYYLGNKLLYNMKVERIWLYSVNGVILIAAMVLFKEPVEAFYLASYAFVLGTGFIVFICEKSFFKVIGLFALFTCFDNILGIVFNQINTGLLYSSEINGILEIILSVILLVILVLIKKKNNFISNNVWIYIKKSFEGIIIVFIVVLVTCFYGYVHFKEYITDERIKGILEDFSIFAVVCAFFLLLFILYIKRVNEKMERVIETEQELNLLQKKYYEMLLEKEEDTRRYRHDMNNHFICLNDLARGEDAFKTLAYIQSLQSDFKLVQKKQYVTGNKVLDLLLNNYLTGLKDVVVTVSGKCTDLIDISDVDMCTIFSNLIKNAVEETERYSKVDKFIGVKVIQGQKYTRVIIKNSSALDEKIDGKKRITSKKDKKNHGFGVMNARTATEKNGGVFEIENTNGEFCVSVTFNSTNK